MNESPKDGASVVGRRERVDHREWGAVEDEGVVGARGVEVGREGLDGGLACVACVRIAGAGGERGREGDCGG